MCARSGLASGDSVGAPYRTLLEAAKLVSAGLPFRAVRRSVAPPGLRKYGDDWVAAGRYPVLAVPSAVVPGEWNYLLNPEHAEFPAMRKSKPATFVYDRRLK